MQTSEHTRMTASRWLSWLPVMVVIVLLCGVDAVVLHRDTPTASGIGYLFDGLALLLPHTSPHDAAVLAEQLRAAFASHRFREGDSGATLSVGVATHEAGEHTSLDDLIATAADALYQAKMQGRNCLAAA